MVFTDPNTQSDSFREWLLSLSGTQSPQTGSAGFLSKLSNAHEVLGASGCSLWRLLPSGELVLAQAHGLGADILQRASLQPSDSAVVHEAIRLRRAVFRNELEAAADPRLSRLGAVAALAAPFFVFGECRGAFVFVENNRARSFNEELAAKATMLANRFGSVLEAERMESRSQEEHRRTSILLELAQDLPVVPDVTAVIEAVTDRIRTLLEARAVGVFLRQDGELLLQGVAAATPQLATELRQAHQGSALIYTAELASRAATAGEPIQVSAGQELDGAKSVIVAPFRTASSTGAVFVYPAAEYTFTDQSRMLLSAVAGFGAVAIANAETCAKAALQAQDLRQLLEINTQLGAARNLEEFLQKVAARSAEFLGFRRSLIVLTEGDICRARYLAEHGEVKAVECAFPTRESRALTTNEPYWSENGNGFGKERRAVLGPGIRQLLDIPLPASDGTVLGLLELFDRIDGAPISKEHVLRGQALAAQVAALWELKRNLQIAEQRRRRAEGLSALAVELGQTFDSRKIAASLIGQAAAAIGVGAAVLMLAPVPSTAARGLAGRWESVVWDRDPALADASLETRLQTVMAEVVREWHEPLTSAPAEDLFGAALAQALGWNDVTLARLESPEREGFGVLCLANPSRPLAAEDEQMLRFLCNQASAALQNARLFQRMEQANRHWLEIFDAITDFIVVHDEAQNVLRVNRSLAQFMRVSPAELIGVSMRALLAMAADTYAADCPFCRKAESGSDESLHAMLDRTYLVSTSRLREMHADGSQTIHVLKDVTDRQEAERRYRELFDNIQEGLYFSTPEGRFIEVNDALVRMLGFESREDLLQVEIPSQLYFDPSERRRFCELIEMHGVLKNHEEVLRRKDGTPVYAMENVFAVRDAQGRVLQYRGLVSDITGLKSFQTELQRERDFSSKILNNTQSLILVVDPAGRISYANRRWADMNYQFQQLLGRRLVDLTPATKRPLLQDALQATLEGRQVDNLEVPILRADGRIGQFSVNLSPMRDEQSALTSIVVVMTDITDAAMLQAKLMHAEKMAAVGQLVSGVAHEVNNPLTAILGFADLLMENPEVPDTARKDLRVILQEAQRTKQIVQNLLSFARQMPPQRKPVQVNTILRRTVQLRAYDFNSHGVEVIEHFSETLPEVVGDAHQLQQVFLNILNNAYDAVRDSGRAPRIEIMTTPGKGYAEVMFRDNGNGILYPDRIFDPFFTTKEVGKGTGLGLSICYGIVREHGGEIFCQNNIGMPGATFTVRLPLAAENISLSAVAGVLPS